MSEYQSAFFIVPSRILNLPNITLAQLRVYETIFQFINHDKPCFLSNQMIKERTGISSYSTINEAFHFFELHGELKRVLKNGKRYFVQPSRHISVENDQPVDKPIAPPIPPYRHTDTPPIGTPIHNINNINSKNINKSFCKEDERKKNNEKKHEWVEKPKPILASVENQSNSYKEDERIASVPVHHLLQNYCKERGIKI